MTIRARFARMALGAVVLLALLGIRVPLEAQEPPRLLVMISVDQLRGDLLDRYASAFDSGLHRLLTQGRRYTGASHAHAVTHTAAGHATLATGVFPSRSGIVANSWDQRTPTGWERGLYAVEDPASPIVGFPDAGGRSPRNLLRSGLADWVLEADAEARVVSLSGKDRAAITMAARSRGEVYWLLPAAGRFVTSTYYRDDYPDWVTEYNETTLPTILGDTLWESSVPLDQRPLARDDEGAPFEGDGVHTTFPHLAGQELTDPGSSAALHAWALRQPRSDRAVLGLAERAIDELELGQRGHLDYLALSFSSTDYVGHDYGPLSQEQLDNLHRLDQDLGELFAHLDDAVGAGRWVVGLSGDHGVMTTPEAMREQGEAGRRVDQAERMELAQQALRAAAEEVGQDPDSLAPVLARTLVDRGIVEAAYTHQGLLTGEPTDSFAVLFRNSHYPGRAAGWFSRFGVEVRFDYHELVSSSTGTTHGSPYWYDRHVPFILMGAGVTAGSSDLPVYSVDLAPTLAGLARIPIPADLDGSPVYP